MMTGGEKRDIYERCAEANTEAGQARESKQSYDNFSRVTLPTHGHRGVPWTEAWYALKVASSLFARYRIH